MRECVGDRQNLRSFSFIYDGYPRAESRVCAREACTRADIICWTFGARAGWLETYGVRWNVLETSRFPLGHDFIQTGARTIHRLMPAAASALSRWW